MSAFPISECVRNVKLIKVGFKEGVSNKGRNKGKKYEGISFTFVKEGEYLNAVVWAVNPTASFYKGDMTKINESKERVRSRIEEIGAVFMRDNGKMVELKAWLEEQPVKNFKVFALKFIEYLDNSNIRSTFVDIKTIPREKEGEMVASIPRYGTFIRKAGDKTTHLTYDNYETKEYQEFLTAKKQY